MIWAIVSLLVLGMLGIYFLPLFVRVIIRRLSPASLLGATISERDFNGRTGAVGAFLSGLGDGISAYDPALRRSYRTLTGFERPFYIEGACTGLRISGSLAPWRGRRNFRKFWNQHPDFVFLLIIGLGFARGLKRFWSSSVDGAGLTEFGNLIDPALQSLFYDGYAFQRFIFCRRKYAGLLRSGLTLEPGIRPAFYGGAGRALWFLIPDFGAFQGLIGDLPEDCRSECLVGFGLATGFAGCEQIPSGSLATYPESIASSPRFRLGLTIGLFARYYVEPEFVERLLGRWDVELLNTVRDAAVQYHGMRLTQASYTQWRAALELKLKNSSTSAIASERSVASAVRR
jgi:hypothetical protein